MNIFHAYRLGESKTKTGFKFMRISVNEARMKGDVDDCKVEKCRDKAPTVKAIGLR